MSQGPQTPGHGIVDQPMSYMRKHPHAQVAEIARFCSTSQSHLYSVFRTATGTTPNRYRQQILVSQAVELLTTTDRTVEDISQLLGFSSPSYLQKRTGKTPKALRKQKEDELIEKQAPYKNKPRGNQIASRF